MQKITATTTKLSGGAGLDQASLAIEAARELLGARFMHKGRGPFAVDCVGLVIIALDKAGLPVRPLDCIDYEEKRAWDYGLEDAVGKVAKPTSLDAIQPGDLVIIQWPRTPAPSHVALVTNYVYGGLGLIHAYSRGGVVEHAITKQWQRRLTGAYRPNWKGQEVH